MTLRTAAERKLESAQLARSAAREAQAARGRGIIGVASVVTKYQVTQAVLGARSVEAMLTEQGVEVQAEALLNSAAFTTSVQMLESMLDTALAEHGDFGFNRVVESVVQDAGRAAESVAVALRPGIGHVRLLTPPSCSRCVVLAGRVYRYSTGFLRHPGDDCIMIPTTLANREFVQDPAELMRQGLVRGLSKADQQAINDGADFNQVVNVRAKASGLTEAGRVLARQDRLTPEGIYRAADGDREALVELLGRNGYIDPRSRRQSPVTSPSNASGGGTPPPSVPTSATSEPEPGSKDDAAYWKARQDALGFPVEGDPLEPHEVRFAERFHGTHGTIERWLAADPTRRRKTNDFYWSERRRETEVKSTKDRYRTIANAIRADAQAKQHFIIDLGVKPLTQALRWQLEKYNQRNPDSQIASLWVLSDNGAAFDEIALE